jgi:hypothetical protein
MTWKRSSRRTTGIGASSNITLKFGINLEPMVPKLLKGQEKKSFGHSGGTATLRLRYSRRLGSRATLLLSSLELNLLMDSEQRWRASLYG